MAIVALIFILSAVAAAIFLKTTLWLIGFLVGGLIIGALARLVLPGEQKLSLLMTSLFGAAGAAVGGMTAQALRFPSIIQYALSIAIAALFISLARKKQSASVL